MKHKEYIIPIGEEAQDYDEMFIGVIRRQPELVRCKDCIYWQDNNDGYPHSNCKWNESETPDPDDYCSGAERKEE